MYQASESLTSVKDGKGPTLTVTDSGFVAHPKVLRWLIDSASENKINYQLETGLPGSTKRSTRVP